MTTEWASLPSALQKFMEEESASATFTSDCGCSMAINSKWTSAARKARERKSTSKSPNSSPPSPSQVFLNNHKLEGNRHSEAKSTGHPNRFVGAQHAAPGKNTWQRALLYAEPKHRDGLS